MDDGGLFARSIPVSALQMKTSTRNQAIAMLMVSIVILLAFWWWTARTPTKTFSIVQIEWLPPSTLQLTLSTVIDKTIYLGKTAQVQGFVPTTPATANQQALITALIGYPFVIPTQPPGIDPSGLIVAIGSLPKGVPSLPAMTLTSASGSALSVRLK
jgi:hypothetical protein